MSYTIGGGGGPAGNDTSDDHALDKPYDIYWPLTQEQVEQVNQMFEQLFKSLRRSADDIEVLESATTPWTVVVKKIDETKSADTTLAADDELFVTLNTNTNYIIRGVLVIRTGAVPDIKFRFTGPTGPTRVTIHAVDYNTGGTVASAVMLDAYSAADMVVSGVGAPATENQALHLFAQIENGTTIGKFNIEWAQNTSNASNTSVYKGSYLEYTTY